MYTRILFFLLFTTSLSALDPGEAARIGKQIFFNECSEKKEKLVWWNQGEDFPSLGIGHFIWYPEGFQGPFEETFPSLLTFFKENRLSLPTWLEKKKGAPWQTREQFLNAQNSSEQKELQQLLFNTMALQAEFIYQRLQPSLSKILASTEEANKPLIIRHLQKLQASPEGKFALIDYLNFKGDGTSDKERYQGYGWGLKQVLEQMPSTDSSVNAFIETAAKLLTQRVDKAPAERQEKNWLPGWLARIERYRRVD